MSVISNTSDVVNNQFHPTLKLLAVRPCPNSPHYECYVDVSLFGCIELRQIRISRNRFGAVITRLPETQATRPGGKPVAAVWISNPDLKAQFDQAVDAALASSNTEVAK